MYFDSFVFSNEGGRSPNEDSAGSFSNDRIHGWIAADGLGGHTHGELASAKVVEIMSSMTEKNTEITDDLIARTLKKMNVQVKNLGGPLTTATIAFSDGETLQYANCGDTRLVFFRKNKAFARSRDHSVAYTLYQAGQIRYEEIARHPDQNHLLHAMGVETDFIGEQYDPIRLKPRDAFLICTDGFWELISEPEMEKTLRISNSAEDWIKLMLMLMEDRLTPTSDNYTAVAVKVH